MSESWKRTPHSWVRVSRHSLSQKLHLPLPPPMLAIPWTCSRKCSANGTRAGWHSVKCFRIERAAVRMCSDWQSHWSKPCSTRDLGQTCGVSAFWDLVCWWLARSTPEQDQSEDIYAYWYGHEVCKNQRRHVSSVCKSNVLARHPVKAEKGRLACMGPDEPASCDVSVFLPAGRFDGIPDRPLPECSPCWRYDQVGWPKVQSRDLGRTHTHTHIRHFAVHGFKAEVSPSVRQGRLYPLSLSEVGCPWRRFTNAFKEMCRGFVSETHRWVGNRPVMCVDHADDLSKSLLSQSHLVNAILNRGQNTLLV